MRVAASRFDRLVPRARRQVVEPDQVHLVAAAVPRDLQQILHACEPRLTGEIVRYVFNAYRRNRIDDDVAVVHSVTTTDFDLEPRPDAYRAPDPAAPNSLAEVFGERHGVTLACSAKRGTRVRPHRTSCTRIRAREDRCRSKDAPLSQATPAGWPDAARRSGVRGDTAESSRRRRPDARRARRRPLSPVP